MQIPARLAFALDPRRSMGMLAALAFSTVVLLATPFLIPEVAGTYRTSLSAASLVSVSQLGGFAIASFLAGRRLSPTKAVLFTALAASIVANLGSAALPPLPALIALRFLSGLSIGTITWFAWSNAFGSEARMSRVAVVGPLIGVAGTPIVAFIIDRFGLAGLFVTLAVLPAIPMSLIGSVPTGERPASVERHKAVTAARIVLLALVALTVGGSAVFQLGVTVGEAELGLSTQAMSIAYSASSLAAIPAAGWKGSRGLPSMWIAAAAVCAFLVAGAFNRPLFFLAIVAWGFAFWMAVPGAFAVLAAASSYPDERVGDAQALMALGRVVGPLVGAALLDGPGNLALGSISAGLLLVAAGSVFTVRTLTERPSP